MARPESIAVGGFFATPQVVTDLLKTWIAIPEGTVTLCDPCAGEGTVLFELANHLGNPHLYFCEMEATRCATIKQNSGRKAHQQHIAHGDFFHLKFTGGCDFLYLNPPYDTDPDCKRLEEKFLRRAVDLVHVGGWMAFVVPYYALAASARTLAEHFNEFTCVRFPDSVWGNYNQVVLFAKRKSAANLGETESNYPELEAMINRWASDASSIPVMEAQDTPKIHLNPTYNRGFYTWEMGRVDLGAIEETFTPWEGVSTVEPPADITRHFRRSFPVASRPRASHLAGAMAAGIFNGMEISPDDPAHGLPPVLIKGVFDKDYRRVEDKINKDGEKVAEVQVQQPKLSVCLLDLETSEYHTVRPLDESASTPTGNPTIDTLTMRDVLAYYGKSLMEGMLRACPVLADDPNYPDVEFPPLAREPFPAQAEAIQTLCKLRQKYPRHGGVILGEIGSGKTTVALTTALAMGHTRLLVLCPPHLLQGWVDEIAEVIPSARALVMESIDDAREFATSDYDGVVIGVLSREKAKLGHKWETVKDRCPKCGGKLKRKNYATKRETCEHITRHPDDALSAWLLEAVNTTVRFLPKHPTRKLVTGRFLAHPNLPRKEWEITPEIKALLRKLVDLDPGSINPELAQHISWVDPSLGMELAHQAKSRGREQRILMAVDDPSDFPQEGIWHGWDSFNRYHAYLYGKGDLTRPGYSSNYVGHSYYDYQHYKPGETPGDLPTFNGAKRGSLEAFRNLMDKVMASVSYTPEVCGERLYQAVPNPRRMPLATWIRRYHPKSYDMLVVDESHEYGSPDSAQTIAAQRLMQTNAYILHLTGSFMNGYAASVFMNMYALSPDFRAEFGRDDLTRFIDRFGYWKQIVQEKNFDGEIIEYGSQSDRVSRSVRKAGVAPGILPLFNLEFLLPIAVTLQKEDLKLGIPPRSDEVREIYSNDDQDRNFDYLKSELMAAIKESRFLPGRAGKLWGAMARLPFYYDLAAVGNTNEGTYEIRWPENTPDVGGQLIVSVPLTDPGDTLPKEEWMLERVAEEIAEGRNCIVFTYHTRLMPRIARLLEEAGHKVAVLEASKVPTAKRLKWITTKVVKKKAQVLVVNPVAVQTGLNNLVHFSTEIWMENPMCNPIVFRQACGRVDRIGQKSPTRIVFPHYAGPQEAAHTLLMHKVGVSTAVDGLDPEEALRAAGLVESDYMAFSVGKQLYKMIMDDDDF